MLMKAGELPLRAFLEPIVAELNDPAVREIVINGPGRIGVERADGWTWRDVPEFTLARLDQIGILAGWLLSKDLDANNPICMSTLPDGQRVTIIRAPAVGADTMSITIRNPSKDERTVFDSDFQALMEATKAKRGRSKVDEELLRLYIAKDWTAFTDLAVRSHKTIAATGTVGSGKTTYIKRLSRSIPADERVITVEDTLEIGNLPAHNRVSLVFGSAAVTAEQCIEAALRMRPDRVLMQELRGREAWAYIRLLAAGHPGGLTTWHAEDGDPFTPLMLMVKQSEAGRTLPDEKLLTIIKSFIDVVAYCKRDENGFSVPSVWFRVADDEGL